MLRAILNKSWRQHPTQQQLHSHQPPITKTIKVRQTRHAGHCWRSRDELVSDILLWTLPHGWAKAKRPARTYIQQLCADTRCSLENIPGAINDREGQRERIKEICAGSTTWWWLWWWWWLCTLKSSDCPVSRKLKLLAAYCIGERERERERERELSICCTVSTDFNSEMIKTCWIVMGSLITLIIMSPAFYYVSTISSSCIDI